MVHGDGMFDDAPISTRLTPAEAREREETRLRGEGRTLLPVDAVGAQIAATFWGKGWCRHLESLKDYGFRLQRGRVILRDGRVIHLDIQSGRIEGRVADDDMHTVSITIDPLSAARRQELSESCTGSALSMLDLLQGRLGPAILRQLVHPERGLFPTSAEIHLDCTCEDHARMCKHTAAVLYGVGNRLDTRPDLLFILRGVSAAEMAGHASTDAAPPPLPPDTPTVDPSAFGDIFGVDIEPGPGARG
jgi:uncharacterized Zn finger protein